MEKIKAPIFVEAILAIIAIIGSFNKLAILAFFITYLMT